MQYFIKLFKEAHQKTEIYIQTNTNTNTYRKNLTQHFRLA